MRLKSEIWVHAFLRRNQVEGSYGAVLRKGAPEAGAVFVVINHLDGTYHLFGPAPGSSHDAEGERRWILELAPPADWPALDARLKRLAAADPDIWIVEVESRQGTAGITSALD